MLDLAAHGLTATQRPEIPGGPQSVAEVLDRTLAADPGRPALVGRHGRLSYAELDDAANRAARVLTDLGVDSGDRVAACLPNDVDIAIAFLACMRLGALWVGVNRPLAPPEKAYLLSDSGARVLLATADVAAEIEPQRGDLPALAEVVVIAPDERDCRWHTALEAATGAPRPDTVVDPWGPAAISYTSGTTGFPKGAVHSQHNIVLVGAVSAWERTYPDDVAQGVVLPLTILNLMILGPVLAWQYGACSVAMDRIDAVGVAAWVRDEKIGSFAAVPTILHDLLTHPDVKPEDLVSLRQPMVGGATCPEEFRDLYRERYGREVAIGYGMTEAPTAVTRADGAGSGTPGLCGKALPQVEISILDGGGRSVPCGEEGEICVGPARTGPWAGIYTPMLGYWGKPDASAEALSDGVYHSGDVGVMEADGTVFIRGRRNELILRGGANVYPAEVERVLQDHPAVAEVAVLGLPDTRLGQRVVAAVVLSAPDGASAEALQVYCRGQLARYKVPERIEIVDAMPRNAMSKVVKRELEGLFTG